MLCNGTKAETIAIKKELGDLLKSMGLTMSEEKTKVTHITEGFIFLGYEIIIGVGTKGKMVTKVLIPENATKRFRHVVRGMLAPNTTEEATTAKIRAVNSFIRGWASITASATWSP